MKPIANYDSAKEEAKKMGNVIPKIPVGGYVLKIESVRYEKGTDGKSDKIVLAYDVAEGEEKGFFKKQFDAITDENKKWKGVATIYVPDEDGNNNDWSVKKFAQTMNCFEESNAGFVWDWDEKKLKGKLIGGIFGEVQKPIDGKDVTWVAFRWFAPVDEIRKNAYKIPDKKVYGSVATETAAQTDGDFMDLGKNINEDLPF